MIILYERTDCPFCWKVRLALAALDVPYESVGTELGVKHPQVLKYSPTGTVPVLNDDKVVIWDSGVMLDYLERCYGSGRLVPSDPAEAARSWSLHAYCDKVIGPALKGLVFEKRSRPEPEWDTEMIRESAEKWRDCQAWLEACTGEWASSGSTFNVGECALAARLGVAEVYGAGITSEFPELARWYRNVTGQPFWQAAYPTAFIGK